MVFKNVHSRWGLGPYGIVRTTGFVTGLFKQQAKQADGFLPHRIAPSLEPGSNPPEKALLLLAPVADGVRRPDLNIVEVLGEHLERL